MEEIWKQINGLEGLYEVSNFGRIKSAERYVTNNRNGGKRKIKEHILKLCDNGHGYKQVFLDVEPQKHKMFYVHRLVADAFLERIPGKNYVNHIDYDTSNNCVSNLEWCTQLENTHHSIERMCVERKNIKKNSTGIKYIHLRNEKRKNGSSYFYYVFMYDTKHIYIEKRFRTLEEAVEFKKDVMEWIAYYKKTNDVSCVERLTPHWIHTMCGWEVSEKMQNDTA